MRRVLVVGMVAIAAVVLYAANAPAGQQAVTPKQFAALTKRVAALEKDNKDLKVIAGVVALCVFDRGAIATTRTPQYHVTAPGEVTDFYVLTTNNQECVNAINSPLFRKLFRKAAAR
jgi:hypothetical protein